MEPLIVLAVTFLLLWVLFILPQQRRVRAHQALVASVQIGDQVILSAGIYGRVVELGPEELMLEVAPGVELRVARQAVLRLIDEATDPPRDVTARPLAGDPTDAPADAGAGAPGVPDPDDRGPATPGLNV
jgi:preprotein translocase subunit YajC